MNCKYFIQNTFVAFLFFSPLFNLAQKTIVVDSSDENSRVVIAGNEYKRSGFYQFLWGNQYRKEWATPVKVPVINLATEAGGLTAVLQGGGRQSLTLRLKDNKGKQYVLRSINKSYSKAFPPIIAGTFIEDLANDQVSSEHPFAAITVPPIIGATGVYHTNPKIVFVPYSSQLGKYNKDFANILCLFEERPVENQEDAPNFGFSEDVKGTEKMFANIFAKNNHRVDQRAYVKARLFDIFLGDWGRHDDQWRWATFDSGSYKIYKPIPRDRDQAYTRFNGFLIKMIFGKEDLEYLKSFSYKISNIKKYNFQARYLDRQLTNEVTKQEWTSITKGLQDALTDEVIEKGIKQMPPELFNISGNEIIAKLKQRRNDLPDYAERYYRFLNTQVEVVGTARSELFQLKKINTDNLQLRLFDLDKEGQPKENPFYSRVFNADETKEIRLYGLKGNDVYHVEDIDKDIRIRIIGGTDKDSLINSSEYKVKYYDNKDNVIRGKVRAHLSNDSAINVYNYSAFKYNSGYTIRMPSYNNTRGIHLLAGYTYTREQWRKEPFGWRQTLRFNYSISNKSFGGDYEAIFNELIGKWNLQIDARYDQELLNYFYGIGNNTKNNGDKNFYEIFTNEGFASVGLNRIFAKYHSVAVGGFYGLVKVKRENGKYISSSIPSNDETVFNRKNFAGAEVTYSYLNINDPVVPTKGFGFNAAVSHTENIDQTNRSVTHYNANLGFYLPFGKAFSLAVRSGASTLNGKPEFYQLNWLGGGANLRGFQRQRFYGESMFYDNNELRWLPDVKTYLFNGKMGLIAFFDNGRVWQPGEDSNKWYVSYGGGFMVAPFNKIAIAIFYGISDEDKLIHFRLGKFF